MDPFFAALIAVAFMGTVFIVFGVLPDWMEQKRSASAEHAKATGNG